MNNYWKWKIKTEEINYKNYEKVNFCKLWMDTTDSTFFLGGGGAQPPYPHPHINQRLVIGMVFVTNNNFLIPISLQPYFVDLRYCKHELC